MKERYKLIRSEIRKGICDNSNAIPHALGFHEHQVKLIDTKTSKILWLCNKCIRRHGKRFRNMVHELSQRDKSFWNREGC